MKLLVTGSNGFVAGSILAQAKSKATVHGIARTIPDHPDEMIIYHKCDLQDSAGLEVIFQQVNPDVAIHAAAIANIDYCQTNQDMARAVNVGITRQMSTICKKAGIKLIFCSTDSVFDGEKGDYVESDSPNAVNFYATTKIEAEKIVLDASAKNVVARLALVMGIPVNGKGNSFLIDLIRKLKSREQVNYPKNEIRTPIDVLTLGSALIELAFGEFEGIIHLAGNTKLNRFDMANRITEMLQFDEASRAFISGSDSNSIPGRARRANDASLNNSKAREVLKTPMLSLEEALCSIMEKTNEKIWQL